MIQSLVELKKEVQELLNILGLLSSDSYSEVMPSCLFLSTFKVNLFLFEVINNKGVLHWTGFAAV